MVWSRKQTKKHICNLGFGSDSMLPKVDGKKGRFHGFRKSLLIAVTHPESNKYFRSYPLLVAERQRQIIEGGQWIIHPYSIFNLVWCTIMLFVNTAFILLAPFRLLYIIPRTPALFSHLDYIIISLKCIVFLDMLVKMNTGYRSSNETFVILTRKRIILHYWLRWGVVDLISCMPSASLIPHLQPPYRVQFFLRLIPCIRCIRLYTVLKDFKIFTKMLHIEYLLGRGLSHMVFFIISLHWCSCLVYLPPFVDIYWKGYLPPGYSHPNVFTTPAHKRYESGVFITCTAFFGNSLGTFRSEIPGEIFVNAIIVLSGRLLLVYSAVLLMKMYFVYYDSTMKYQELMDQVEKYMRRKEFPLHLVQRVRDFYNYRYQRQYFKERFVLDCLSEQLRNEIFLDTCHKLIDKVALFEGLPASIVGTVLGCLKPEVYMRNDLIIKAGDNGSCMYFISNGTVAVISLKGAEVCHLDDGAHFGEIALLMKDQKRVATVVAIEITQVYRLDVQDFRDFIITYHELYERIQDLAAKRMHETVLIDEEFKVKKMSSIHGRKTHSDGSRVFCIQWFSITMIRLWTAFQCWVYKLQQQ